MTNTDIEPSLPRCIALGRKVFGADRTSSLRALPSPEARTRPPLMPPVFRYEFWRRKLIVGQHYFCGFFFRESTRRVSECVSAGLKKKPSVYTPQRPTIEIKFYSRQLFTTSAVSSRRTYEQSMSRPPGSRVDTRRADENI